MAAYKINLWKTGEFYSRKMIIETTMINIESWYSFNTDIQRKNRLNLNHVNEIYSVNKCKFF